MKSVRARLISLAGMALVLATGCSSARVSDREVDEAFRTGQYDRAEAKLREGLAKQGTDGRDLLLYLMDLGLALRQSGKFKESNQIFLEADKIAEIKDYTSLSKEFSTFLVSDNIKDYKGEDFEKVLINVYLSLNYAAMGDVENALVEARVVNRKLHMMISQGERKYKQNGFARYLSGILYESERNWNDAYIDYKYTRDLEPGFPGLGLDLWRLAALVGNREDMERWDKEYKLTAEEHKAARALNRKLTQGGEIVVIYENGISPIKKPNPSWGSLPHFVPRHNPVSFAQVEINGVVQGSTRKLHDIEQTAIENMRENYTMMVAKKAGGAVAKIVVAKQVENITKSPLAGALAQLAFFAADQADLRSWNLLPRDLQIARVPVEAGTYTVRVNPMGAAGPLPEKVVEVGKGGKVFVNFRYMP